VSHPGAPGERAVASVPPAHQERAFVIDEDARHPRSTSWLPE